MDFDSPEQITGLFTAGNILEDSFELTYFDQDQRQPPRVSVKWRQEETTGDLDNRGLFPIIREVTVRESTTQALAPLEQLDLSDFCTSQQHAIDRAKFECRFRLSTHQVKFTTTADQASLSLGKCFRLGMETLTYDQPRNGYIAEDGTVTSWPELADGSYLVVSWDGSSYTETQSRSPTAGATKPAAQCSAWRTTCSIPRPTRCRACRSTRKGTSMSKPSTGRLTLRATQTWWSIGTTQVIGLLKVRFRMKL